MIECATISYTLGPVEKAEATTGTTDTDIINLHFMKKLHGRNFIKEIFYLHMEMKRS